MNTWQRLSLWGFGALGLAALALIAAKPYMPMTIPFYSTDAASVDHYKGIVAAHGYSFRVEPFSSGTYVLIDRISLKEYESIENEYLTWEAERARATGLPAVDPVH